ncbi:hypothetical protein [Tessaracoccus coleopterorum]|uniref:hypothetical protein n=1 Tax=Tessaracoccus coleopterorum TaxID=2714950 RepID=UPI0018D47F2A|nr:hypothetical protein [Tessaracoccus coleopterorum]
MDVGTGARLTAAGGIDPAPLSDDDPEGDVELPAGGTVVWSFDGATRVEAYTLTGPDRPVPAASWLLEALIDGAWATIDAREAEPFEWPGQLRAFVLDASVTAEAVRLVPGTALRLAQVELLALTAR